MEGFLLTRLLGRQAFLFSVFSDVSKEDIGKGKPTEAVCSGADEFSCVSPFSLAYMPISDLIQ